MIGYTYELKNKGKDAGYIFVKYIEDEVDLSISEFSYDKQPLYKLPKIKGNIRDVYSVGMGEYLILATSNKIFDVEGNEVDRAIISNEKPSKKFKSNELNKQLKGITNFNIDEWMVGYNGQVPGANGTNAGINDVYQYVNDRYASGWIYATNKVLPVTPYLMSTFHATDQNNCVLSSVTTVLKYYQQHKGYTSIPSNINTIYTDVRPIAIANGYTNAGGTPPTNIDNILNQAFTKYGYTVGAANHYVLAFSTFKTEIDNNRPVLFSNANGYYANHNFVVIGYRTYNRGSDTKSFLRVNDNWTTSERWFDYSAWSCCGSLTKLNK